MTFSGQKKTISVFVSLIYAEYNSRKFSSDHVLRRYIISTNLESLKKSHSVTQSVTMGCNVNIGPNVDLIMALNYNLTQTLF